MATEIFAILAASGLAIAGVPAAQNTRSAAALPVASNQLASAAALKPVGASCFVQQAAGRVATVQKACSAKLAAAAEATECCGRTQHLKKTDLIPIVLITTGLSVGINQAINSGNSRD
jgi:hypothetical protein